MSIGYDGSKSPKDSVKINCGPGRTKQAFKDQVDINKIAARYRRASGGELLDSGVKLGTQKKIDQAFYGDVSAYTTYQEAVNFLIQADGMFKELPAATRERFSNDPARMLDFLGNKENYEEAVKLGLVARRPTEAEIQAKADSAPATSGDMKKVVEAVKSVKS